MVVQVQLWYELWTSLMDLCWIIFLFSDLVTEEALIVLHTDEMEEASNKRNALASLTKDVVFECCNDLILCWCLGADGSYRYVICNPMTLKFNILPPSTHDVGC